MGGSQSKRMSHEKTSLLFQNQTLSVFLKTERKYHLEDVVWTAEGLFLGVYGSISHDKHENMDQIV